MGKTNKILITGATGLIGRSLLKQFDTSDYELQILVLDKKEGQHFLEELNLEDASLAVYKNDFPSETISKFSPDIVLHLAGYTTNSLAASEINKLIDANLKTGTLLLSSLFANPPQYFINVGSCMEYHDNSEGLDPGNLYAASKTAFRTIVDFFQKKMNFNWIQTNLYFVYGDQGKRKKVIDYVLSGMESSTPVKMSPGLQSLDFIHIDDITSFFSMLLKDIESCNEKYNEFHVGTGTAHTIQEVAETITTISQKELNLEWGGIDYRKGDIMFSKAPLSNNPDFLKWNPKISLEEGLKKILNNENRI